MSVEKEAAVRVRLTGDEEIVSQTAKVSNAWSEVATKATSAFKTMGGAIGGAVQGVLSDLGHVVTAAGAISFAGSVQGVEKLEESVSRMGVATGRSISSVQAGINSLSQEIGELPAQTEAWVHSVGDLTYSYERAAQSARGLQGYALQTGQSLGQVAPLASVLDQIGAGGENAGRALNVMTKQAEMLGTVGGPKALGDMMNHLAGQITSLSSSTGPAKITALMAGFGGNKGFTPQQREKALGGVLGRLEGNVEGFERHFGVGRGGFTDEYGHMKNPTDIIAKLQEYGKKSQGARFRLEQTFGREQTAAIMKSDIAGIKDAEKALGGGASEHALARMKDTPAGKKRDQEIRKDIAMQKAVGSDSLLGGFRRQIGEWSADSPVLTALGTSLAGSLPGAAVGYGLKAMGAKAAAGAAAGGGGTAAAGGGGGGILGGIGLGGLAAGGAVLAGVLMQGKVLTELGAASAAKQGYSNRVIGRDEAATLSGRASAANEAAYANMSPGMRKALELEQAAKAQRQSAQAGGAPGGPLSAAAGPDPKTQAMIESLVKAGASLQLAQETAAKILQAGQQPIQIEIINPTGADIEARPRGRQ